MPSFDYPLLLKPVPVPKVWAGGKLGEIPGRATEGGGDIGESWDVSTWPTAPDNPNLVTVTPIANGPLAGTPLDRVTDLPVVVKVIDSGDKLSVQNHPDLPDNHKSEMWYILESDRDSYLYLDLAKGITPEAFCDLLRQDPPDEEKILAALDRYDAPRPGTHFNVPAPMVHALGPGLLTFEISERDQTTYRLYDYNRPRSRGKLDIEPGCAALVIPHKTQPPLDPGLLLQDASSTELITAFPTFCVMRARGRRITVLSAKHPHLITACSGPCRISGPTAQWEIELGYTFTCLAPATDRAYTIDVEGGEVLISPVKG